MWGKREKGRTQICRQAAKHNSLFFVGMIYGKEVITYMPKSDGWKNLIPKTPEECREMGKRGGEANKRRIEREKTFNELAKALLKQKISENKARTILGDYSDLLQGDFSIDGVMILRQVIEAMDGNTKAIEFIRDTSGYKPTERIESDVIITDGDRSLLEKIAKRTGVTETDG